MILTGGTGFMFQPASGSVLTSDQYLELPTYSGPGNAGTLYDQPLRPRMSLSNIVDIHVPCVRRAGCV